MAKSEIINHCPLCGSEATLWRTVIAVPGQMVIACGNTDSCGIYLDSRRINGAWEAEKELSARWNRLESLANQKHSHKASTYGSHKEQHEEDIAGG